MQPKVSIVVPVYKVEKYLERCVTSLRNQSMSCVEIILVDDGSPDSCPQMCDRLAELDSRIKVVHKANGGLGFARNSGLDVASGEYVTFVDSDDFVDQSMYETLYNEASQSNSDAVFSSYIKEVTTDKWVNCQEVTSKRVLTGHSITTFFLDMIASAPGVSRERQYEMSTCRAIYRRQLIENHSVRFLSEKKVVSEDLFFQIDFLRHAEKGTFLPLNFYHYCFNQSSLTNTFLPEKYERFKFMRESLLYRIKSVDGSEDRVNRLFIGYIRSYLQQLVRSNRSDKSEVLDSILSDSIWDDLKNSYPKSNLPVYQRISYSLICKKRPALLTLYIKFSIAFKQLLNK